MSLETKLDPVLEPLMGAVRRVEEFLGPEDDWVEADRRIAFQAAQRLLGGLHTFVYEKSADDYVTTVHASPDAVESALMPPYDRNLASARKYRTHHDGGRQWACGSFAVELDKGREGLVRQHHVYLFEAPGGGTDVYAHSETSVVEGGEHLSNTNQESATPHVLFDIFDRVGFEYGTRNL